MRRVVLEPRVACRYMRLMFVAAPWSLATEAGPRTLYPIELLRVP